MQDVYSKMISTIEERELLTPDGGLLLMVSGGSDSTALARLAARLRDEGRVAVVDMLHMNHKLRGEDADEDARFVANLASKLEIPLFACEMDIVAEARRTGENIEAVARRERYAAANEAMVSMCQHEGIPVADARIATAHTADDRIENFYMRSIVGTGPGGFRSMLYRNGPVVRPLLDCTRHELRCFLEQEASPMSANGLVMEAPETKSQEEPLNVEPLWREDATNAHTDRFRAYVRHKIVPVAREWNSSLDTTLVRTMNLIAEEDDMLDDMADRIIREDVESLGSSPEDGFLLLPAFGSHARPLARRAVHSLLKGILGMDERVDSSAVEAILDGFEDGLPASGYVANTQGNLAVSSNKKGVRVEPMEAFRARRKRSHP